MKPARFVAAVASVGVIAAALVAEMAAQAQGNGWRVEGQSLNQPVTALRQVGAEVFVETGGWRIASVCPEGICFERTRPPIGRLAWDGIPGGTIASAAGQGVTRAWFIEPTTRYDHGILGDHIEGGGLTVVDDSGRRHSIILGPDLVFEDLTPRIADIDNDGLNDVIVIRSSLSAGAAVAVYSLTDGELGEISATNAIGQPYRWLNIAGIADFDADGTLDIALVRTPHIGGTLEFWTMRRGDLVRLAAAGGFSNHAIGSPELDMSAIGDFDGDGTLDLAVPSADRTTLRIVRLVGNEIDEIASVSVGLPIVTAIAALCGDVCRQLLLGRSDGSLIVVRSP